MLDPKRPLRLRMPDMREVTLVGVTSTGDIVVEIEDTRSVIAVFDMTTGRVVGSSDPFTPVLVQDVVSRSTFHPLNVIGEPQPERYTSLKEALEVRQSVARFLEIAFEDDIPKKAKIHAR